MTKSIAIVSARQALIFDVDGSQFGAEFGLTADPCSICGVTQGIHRPPRAFVRIRRKVTGGSKRVALLCPDCIGRAMIKIIRHELGREMTPAVRGTLRRMFNDARRVAKPKR